jgi:hypothetical protein
LEHRVDVPFQPPGDAFSSCPDSDRAIDLGPPQLSELIQQTAQPSYVYTRFDFEKWPFEEHRGTLFNTKMLGDEVLWLHANSLGQFIAGFVKAGSGEVVCSCMTCPTVADGKVSLGVFVTRSDTNQIRVFLDGHMIGSTDPADKPLSFYSVPKQNLTHYSGPMTDFTKENSDARLRRDGLFTGHQTRPGRQLGDENYMLGELRSNLRRLRDQIELVQGGKLDHAIGIASQLRLLIAEKGALLQTCASISQLPLILYTHPEPTRELPIVPHIRLNREFEGSPTGIMINPVDLDVWLDFTGGYINAEPFSNRKLMLQVGHNVASHVDRNIHPYVTMLRQSTVAYRLENNQPVDLLVRYFTDVGQIVADLADKVLAASDR